MADMDKPLISLQVPETFRDVCVPVKPVAGAGPAERPFPIPPDDEFDLTKKRTMEVVIQLKFKEWLSSTSNVRQILDLVHLDARTGCEPGAKVVVAPPPAEIADPPCSKRVTPTTILDRDPPDRRTHPPDLWATIKWLRFALTS
ncbi:Major facilitator superfamily domain-containing protein 6 [Phytophthora cinnamomi]|uniref:Major facilitator superfamily domain-containing protein 6 n=1 Tax=Phytophthora cinnamomi TaxID=4785 RepID=UPI003559A526|nr:Major facilitator superfamily domain-containing protein 6 [Phytophthora cinnamomi]